jgi:hypothetical protein
MVAGLAALSAALAGCAGLGVREPVNVSVVGMEPLPGQGMEGRFLVKLRVQNPNDRPIDYDGVSLELDLRGSRLATGFSDERWTVPRFGETFVQVPVSVPVRIAQSCPGAIGKRPTASAASTATTRAAMSSLLYSGSVSVLWISTTKKAIRVDPLRTTIWCIRHTAQPPASPIVVSTAKRSSPNEGIAIVAAVLGPSSPAGKSPKQASEPTRIWSNDAVMASTSPEVRNSCANTMWPDRSPGGSIGSSAVRSS